MQFDIDGFVAPGFEPVRDTFRSNWDNYEIGASVAVFHRGECIVDLWGGYTDRDMSKPWQRDTLVNVYSTTKGIASLVIAILADDGLIDYAAPVTDYWPEFSAHGKGTQTVAQVLSHQAGVAGLREPLTVPELYDLDDIARRLAAMQPLWPPGSAVGYHAVTWGHLAAELARRVSGTSLGHLLATRIAGPLGADFFIGLPDTEDHRVADLIGATHGRVAPQPPAEPPAVGKFYPLALGNPTLRPYKDSCSTPWRRAELPGVNGHGNARSIARIYAALANNGTLDGQRIISTAGIDAATTQEVGEQPDLVLGRPLRRARGFILNTENQYGPNPDAFGHTGAGGSLGFADRDHNIGFGYAMNQMQINVDDEPRAGRLLQAVYSCL